jgi:tetratricopeptide (TPR) repeat protein
MPTSAQIVAKVGAELEMARACFDLGDYDETITLAASALPSLVESDERFKALQLIACSEACKGDLKTSLKTLTLIGEFLDSLPAKSKAKFYGQRAYAHSRLGNGDAALVDLTEARYWAEESSDQQTIARARNNLAKHYDQDGRREEALAESDAAVKFADRFPDEVLRGQIYDRRAQILVNAKRYSEALAFSSQALVLLEGHPSLAEARETYGRALIGLGVTYLEQKDPIATFAAKRRASEMIRCTLDENIVHLALERSNGRVSKAAELVGVHHEAMAKAAKKYGSDRAPVFPRPALRISKK